MTHLATYTLLSPEAKRLLAELEERRRDICRMEINVLAKAARMAAEVHAADYLIRLAAKDAVLANADIERCMELALEEVG